jgi:hypothetical protein
MAYGDKPGIIARDAAQAAAHAAVQAGGRSGVKTSEFWVSIGSAILGTVCLALIPTPFGAIGATALAIGAGAYANSRGNVKGALVSAGMSVLNGVAQGVPGTVGTVAGAAAAVVQAELPQAQPVPAQGGTYP